MSSLSQSVPQARILYVHDPTALHHILSKDVESFDTPLWLSEYDLALQLLLELQSDRRNLLNAGQRDMSLDLLCQR